MILSTLKKFFTGSSYDRAGMQINTKTNAKNWWNDCKYNWKNLWATSDEQRFENNLEWFGNKLYNNFQWAGERLVLFGSCCVEKVSTTLDQVGKAVAFVADDIYKHIS